MSYDVKCRTMPPSLDNTTDNIGLLPGPMGTPGGYKSLGAARLIQSREGEQRPLTVLRAALDSVNHLATLPAVDSEQ